MRQEPEWATCPDCNSPFLPKMAAKIEFELNNLHTISYQQDYKSVRS